MTGGPLWIVAASAWLLCLAVWLPDTAWRRFIATPTGHAFDRAWDALRFDLPDRIRRHR